MNLNFYSALFGLIGTCLIFFFGIPPKIDPEGNVALTLEGADKGEIEKAKKYKLLGYLGLVLIAISFLFQLVASAHPREWQREVRHEVYPCEYRHSEFRENFGKWRHLHL